MIIHFAVTALTVKSLYRECPGCGHVLRVPHSKRNEIVICNKCEFPTRPSKSAA